jgi:ABC-type transport system substrate-binding protein
MSAQRRTRWLALALGAGLLIGLAVGHPVSVAQGETTVTLGTLALNVGESGIVEGRIDCGAPDGCGAFALALRFDPAIIQIDQIEPGPYLGADALVVERTVDNAAGVARLAVVAMGATPALGEPVLLRLQVTALAPGLTTITVTELLVSDLAGNPVAAVGIAGAVAVTAAAAPTAIPLPTATPIEALPANNPPVIASVPGQSLAVGEVIVVSYAAVDPDGDPLTVIVGTGDPGVVTAVVLEPGQARLTGLAPGSSLVTLTVDDGRGGQARTAFTVTVVAPGPTPVPTAQASPEFQPMTSAAPDCDYGGELYAVEALDEFTVRFTLCQPDAAFAAKLAVPSFGIQSAAYLEESGGVGPVDRPIGTGPYLLSDWSRGGSITLARFDSYWGAPASMPTVEVFWNGDSVARVTALSAGEVDGIDEPPLDSYARLSSDPALALYERAPVNVFYIGFNNRFAPLDDARVRRALALAIDRQALLDQFFPPGAILATQFMPPSAFGYADGLGWHDYDPEMARQLLAEADYPDGLYLQLYARDVVRSYLPDPLGVAYAIQEQLRANLNVNVEVIALESVVFLDALDNGETPMFLMGWIADYPDATGLLDFHFGSSAGDWFGAPNPELVALLDEARVTADPAARLELYWIANELIKEDVAMIPVAHVGTATAFRADITGAHASPLYIENFAVMRGSGAALRWMQSAEPESLYCADAYSSDAWRVCAQINETLVTYAPGGSTIAPGLAAEWMTNEDATVWTFRLREGVLFHDGSTLDANDVVVSFAVQWDAAHPLHVGDYSGFVYFQVMFGAFLNQ